MQMFFLQTELMQRRKPVKLNYKGLEIQKRNIPTEKA